MPGSFPKYLILIHIISSLYSTDVKPTEHFSHNLFNAQEFCLGQGLTIDREKSDKPYWTGVYRRLTPWIKILGQTTLFYFLVYISFSSVNFYIQR